MTGTCDKCQGKGSISYLTHVDGGVCYQCHGLGTVKAGQSTGGGDDAGRAARKAFVASFEGKTERQIRAALANLSFAKLHSIHYSIDTRSNLFRTVHKMMEEAAR